MEVEWDEAKRQQVLDERGLDFADVINFDAASLEIMKTCAGITMNFGLTHSVILTVSCVPIVGHPETAKCE